MQRNKVLKILMLSVPLMGMVACTDHKITNPKNNSAISTDNQPTNTDNQQTSTDNQQTSTDNQPTNIDNQQTSTDNQPTNIDNQQTSTDNQQTSTDNQPTNIDNQQTSTDNQPTNIDNQQTSTDNQQTNIDNQQTNIDNQQTNLQMQTLQRNNMVYFDLNKYQIGSNFTSMLDAHANFLKNNQYVKIMIEGHTDERGTLEYNLYLGERRAESVKKYLQNKGVSAEQIAIVSYGKARPAILGHNETAYAKNRRAVIVYQ